MNKRRVKKLWMAAWLSMFALAAAALEQNQFGLTVLSAVGIKAHTAFDVPVGYHLMPDGTLMVGAAHGTESSPTSPSNNDADPIPSDCSACVTIAAMGAFTLPAASTLAIPLRATADVCSDATLLVIHRFAHPAYASRAPPHQQA